MTINARRRTKIVATMGPSCDRDGMLETLVKKGVNVFRANFSHGSHDDHARRINTVREISKRLGTEVAILADLQGPKIRVARFKENKIFLEEGATFTLDANLGTNAGDEKAVGLDYRDLPKDVGPGDVLLLDDGRIVLTVDHVVGEKVICKVTVGGELSNNKGINKQGGGLSADVLTDKDIKDLKFAATLDVDYFAISFVRCADDMDYARKLIREAGSAAGLIAKLERVEAAIPATIDEIINASEGIMVARGDLGVEIGDAEVPAVQKLMIQRARALNKPVITATQMMETMIHNAIPTRAEVSDVANAVLDNTDAVMLSAESASGDHPDVVVDALVRICIAAERMPETQSSGHRVECHFEKIDETIAMAAMYAANHVDIKAIISLTESGSTPLLMSRIRSAIPIFALTRNIATERKMSLYCGVYPMSFDVTKYTKEDLNAQAVALLKKNNIADKEDLVLITEGDIIGKHGHTNTMKIYKVNDLG